MLLFCKLVWLEIAVHVIFVSRLGLKFPLQLSFYFIFSCTLCLFFSCFVLFVMIRLHLILFERALVSDFFSFDLSNVYLCRPGSSHMDN